MDASFGIRLPGLVPGYARTLRELIEFAVELEAIGFDDVTDSEHVLFTRDMRPPCSTGNMVLGRDTQRSDRADTLVVLTAIAARTTRLKLASATIHAAVHSFGVLAGQAATLDVLSQGRLMLGVGTGWNGAAFAALGVPPAEGRARLEETVRACRELWKPGLASFHGRWISFDDVISEPAPYTPGGPPLWYAGNALQGSTASRVAELCAGWLSREQASYDEIARSAEAVRAACAKSGRDPAGVGIRASVIPTSEWQAAASTADLVRRIVGNATRLAAAGVTHFTIPLSYFQLARGDLELLLQALRAA